MTAVTQPMESCLCLGGLCPHPCNLLLGCGKQKNHGEGKGEELFPPTAKTKFESPRSSAYPLSPPRGSSPDPSGHLTMESQHLGHVCPGVMGLYQYWKGAPHAPQCVHFHLPSSAPDHTVWAQTHSCGLLSGLDVVTRVFFLLAVSCKMFSIEPRRGALSPSLMSMGD